LATIVEA